MSKDRTVIQRSRPGEVREDCRVLVIGGGISGLVTAHALLRQGVAVTVLERGPVGGGAVSSLREGPFLAERGPHTLQVTTVEQLLLLGELGLRPRVRFPNPAAKKRFLWVGGQPVAAPSGPGGLLGSPLFSLGGKLRLLAEPFARKRRGSAQADAAPSSGSRDVVEESVADFVRRRLGREVLEHAVDPLVGGIYAGDPERLSLAHAFPKLAEWEAAGGSLLRGALKGLKNRPAERLSKALTVSFPEGLGELSRALEHSLEGPGTGLRWLSRSRGGAAAGKLSGARARRALSGARAQRAPT